VLAKNATTKDGTKNTSGDWALIHGPISYQWGGTWLGVVKGSKNIDLAMDYVRFATLDQEHLTNWATGVYTHDYLAKIDPTIAAGIQHAPGDFVSSQAAVKKLIPLFDKTELSAFLGGQNSYAIFAEIAPKVNVKLMTPDDDNIQRALDDPMDQYLGGKMTEEQMWKAWKDNVRLQYPDLVIP